MTNREMYAAVQSIIANEEAHYMEFMHISGEADDNAADTCRANKEASRDDYGWLTDAFLAHWAGSIGVMLAFDSQYATPAVRAWFDSAGLRY